MANPDLMDKSVRINIIDEINNDENVQRKKESLRRFEMFKKRQARYILDRLRSEFSEKTVREMRKVLSINLVERIIKEQASIYNNTPERVFSDFTDSEIEALEMHYDASNVNVMMKKANQFYKLFDQCALMVVPKGGKITLKAMAPHWYDVIPDENDPEKPYAYILNILDKHQWVGQHSDASYEHDNSFGTGTTRQLEGRDGSDGINQSIGDGDDYKSENNKYIVWTKDTHFVMNGRGKIVTEEVDNPIGELPFIDIATDKDFEYFIRKGSSVVDFAIDFGVQLSDHSNILRLQGYSQAIISAEKQPDNMVVGPNHILFLQQDPNSNLSPDFKFASPAPDLSASIATLEMQMKLFLSDNGKDPKTIVASGEGKTFASGLDRLLSMISEFEANRTDMDLFQWVEQELFRLIVLWNNVLQDANDPAIALDDSLKNGMISESGEMDITYSAPESIQTKSEKEDSIIKRQKEGLISKLEAIMEDRGVDETAAQEILDKIQSDKEVNLPLTFGIPGATNGETEDNEE
jgi:hypothetical protein